MFLLLFLLSLHSTSDNDDMNNHIVVVVIVIIIDHNDDDDDDGILSFAVLYFGVNVRVHIKAILYNRWQFIIAVVVVVFIQ